MSELKISDAESEQLYPKRYPEMEFNATRMKKVYRYFYNSSIFHLPKRKTL